MTPEHAQEFSLALFRSVGERSAGRFGFSLEPREVAEKVDQILPSFRCGTLLNVEAFGRGDGFGLLLNHVNRFVGGSIECGFVVGSRKQSVGCATNFVTVMREIDDSLKRCAQDLGW